MRRNTPIEVGLAAVLAWSCGAPVRPGFEGGSASLEEFEVHGAPDGLSGLASDTRGLLWAIAESGAGAVRMDHAGRDATNVAITGVPADVELESVGFFPNGDLAIGTETESNRNSDLVLLAQPNVGHANLEVYDHIRLPYELWGIDAPPNHGIEALCVTRDALVVVAELAMQSGQHRFAPMAIYDLSTSTWKPLRLQLTSRTGTISGIACRRGERGLEFIAIERDYPVRRVLRGTIDDDAVSHVFPTLLLDISTRSENLEGIAWLDEASFALVSDNSSGGEHAGVAKLLVARPAASRRWRR